MHLLSQHCKSTMSIQQYRSCEFSQGESWRCWHMAESNDGSPMTAQFPNYSTRRCIVQRENTSQDVACFLSWIEVVYGVSDRCSMNVGEPSRSFRRQLPPAGAERTSTWRKPTRYLSFLLPDKRTFLLTPAQAFLRQGY
jgi:hypothetical protein